MDAILRNRWVEVSVWCCGVTLVVSLVHGWVDYEFEVRWRVAHAARGDDDDIARFYVAPVVWEEELSVLVADPPHEPRWVRRYGSRGALVAQAEVCGAATRIASVAIDGARVYVARNDSSVASLDASTLASRWDAGRVFEDPSGDIAAAISGDRVYVVASDSATTRFAALDDDDGGRRLWVSPALEHPRDQGFLGASEAGPLPRPRNAWESDARFWAARDLETLASSFDGPEIAARDLVAGRVVTPWTGGVVLEVADDVLVFRTRLGLEAIDAADGARVARAALPPAALHADLDRDGALDTVAAVESHRPAPRRRKSYKRAAPETHDDVPPCFAVATRGFPPVERYAGLEEASLCHDAGREIDRRVQRRSDSRRLVFVAPPLPLKVRSARRESMIRLNETDGLRIPRQKRRRPRDVVFAVSRGVLTRIGADGEHKWLVRGSPAWNAAHQGHLRKLRRDTLLIVSGPDNLALFAAYDGSLLADFDLPFVWDDEVPLLPPVLHEPTTKQGGDPLLVVVSQFAVYAIQLRSQRAGRLPLRLLVIFLSCLVPALAFLVAYDL
ncbi:hypothetical protein CTAYLR_009367 [Chrysophaeum taylorii]|uniref:Pyrrolo-quinoline quinone repeat domain-containing protein n=1 Tax=Chrysophaeum taylorii TaxID=2483200 RepID=A0AAD7XJ57_9STRA|nr:hypothetical protein CTAYLR_009367 [Chrysophaeum taylorii]